MASGHVTVIGSYAELAERAGALPADFDPHRPDIDEVRFDCDCGAPMTRVPEVLDAIEHILGRRAEGARRRCVERREVGVKGHDAAVVGELFGQFALELAQQR